jgi:AcrR family transcriptional regulator
MPEATHTARRGRPGYDRGAVLAVAVQVFIEHGYEATSMGMLAERLGLSKAGIYHHVPGKEHLLRLALDEALGALERVIAETESADARPIDRLEAVVRGAVEVLVDKLPYVTLLLRVRGNTDVERDALARRRAFTRSVERLVDLAREDGSLRSDVDSRVAARLLFGMINSIVEWYRPDGSERVGDLANDVIAVAFGGLRA